MPDVPGRSHPKTLRLGCFSVPEFSGRWKQFLKQIQTEICPENAAKTLEELVRVVLVIHALPTHRCDFKSQSANCKFCCRNLRKSPENRRKYCRRSQRVLGRGINIAMFLRFQRAAAFSGRKKEKQTLKQGKRLRNRRKHKPMREGGFWETHVLFTTGGSKHSFKECKCLKADPCQRPVVGPIELLQ